jgi:hypothetical protein
VLVVARVGLPGGAADAPAGFAGAGNPAVAVVPVANGLTRPVSAGQADGEAVLRDERLDEYLRAHQIARGGATITAPSSALRRRSSETQMPRMPRTSPWMAWCVASILRKAVLLTWSGSLFLCLSDMTGAVFGLEQSALVSHA